MSNLNPDYRHETIDGISYNYKRDKVNNQWVLYHKFKKGPFNPFLYRQYFIDNNLKYACIPDMYLFEDEPEGTKEEVEYLTNANAAWRFAHHCKEEDPDPYMSDSHGDDLMQSEFLFLHPEDYWNDYLKDDEEGGPICWILLDIHPDNIHIEIENIHVIRKGPKGDNPFEVFPPCPFKDCNNAIIIGLSGISFILELMEKWVDQAIKA